MKFLCRYCRSVLQFVRIVVRLTYITAIILMCFRHHNIWIFWVGPGDEASLVVVVNEPS